ncbi:DNA-directed RNA polymerases II, IV and V subunit 12 [Acrasis kona]|uniref:DNA-directed RNA polymerases II, IV and V subunit 12 n=1 Tax=Acrasis kona TaxID=1008807 RepID=A0AAW2ZH80_9EUKA
MNQSPGGVSSPVYSSPTSGYPSYGVSSPMAPAMSPNSGSMSASPFSDQPFSGNARPQQQAAPPQPSRVLYICGLCGQENAIKPEDAIRCRECGYRIMYKKRTKRKIQFEAR